MATKIVYKVYPDTPSNFIFFSGGHSNIDTPSLATLLMLDIYIGIGWGILNLFTGGSGYFTFMAIAIILYSIIKFTKKQRDKINAAIKKCELLSEQLSDILTRSEEIVTTILPYFEDSVQKSLEFAKIDFSDNAISPFWDRVEEAGKFSSCYKESADQLRYNCEVYTNILAGKRHNFPQPFPYGTSVSISQNLLDEYNLIVRRAQTKYKFASIWEHRNTQRILIADLASFEQVKDSVRDSIVSAIGELNHSIKSEIKELKKY